MGFHPMGLIFEKNTPPKSIIVPVGLLLWDLVLEDWQRPFILLPRGMGLALLKPGTRPGGRARVFREKGYLFDAGPTVITAPYLFQELFQLLSEEFEEYVQLVPVNPFYRILFPDGSQFDYVGEEEALLENIHSLSPKDVEGYRRLASHARSIFDVGYKALADQPFDTLSSMLRVVPDMIRLENYKSVYGLVSKYIKDERLRQAFSFEPLLVGGNPHSITSIYLLIHWLERKWGVHFAKGGTHSIVKAMCQVLEKHGVEFHYNNSLDSVTVDRGQVRQVHTSQGLHLPCDVLVSNADPVQTYQAIDPYFRKKHTNSRLLGKAQSMSLFVSYFGVRKKYSNIAHHTILLGPRYKGLLDDIFKRKVLSEDFSLYLHAPTVTDQSLAPHGHECFYVLSPVPNNKSGLNWSQIKEEYQEKILTSLEERLLPQLGGSIDCKFSITPDYFEKTLQSTQGSAFGIEPRLSQSAYFRFHNRSEDVHGLYFVGANTHPGAGVPGVLNSAKVLGRILPHSQDWKS